jgi:hypothetical protein
MHALLLLEEGFALKSKDIKEGQDQVRKGHYSSQSLGWATPY